LLLSFSLVGNRLLQALHAQIETFPGTLAFHKAFQSGKKGSPREEEEDRELPKTTSRAIQ
jgi:hypothetical protein